jgi:VWFA-related protein
MTRVSTTVFAFVRIAALSGWIGADLLSPETVSAQAARRELYVSVVDKDGNAVTGLSPDAFVVREDGVSREILAVRPATAPMEIALLVDDSQAAESSMQNLRTALNEFVAAMTANNSNRIALISLGDRPTIRVEYTSKPDELKHGIDRLFAQPGSGAYLLDAIVDASRGMERRKPERGVIVAVTTEGPELSNLHYQPVLEAVEKAGAAFHSVMLTDRGEDPLTDEIRNRNLVIDLGTKKSGGRRDTLLTSMAFSARLKQLAGELQNQYVVTYARPATLIPPENVEISATNPAFQARGTAIRPIKGA